MFSDTEKKKLMIYIIIAYGITCLMGLLMWYGNAHSLDVSAFPNAQMMYPAAGVMLALLLTGKKNPLIPRGFFWTFILITILLMAVSVLSLLMPDQLIPVNSMVVNVWQMAISLVLMVGSITCWILYLGAGEERREAMGLKWHNTKDSWLCILLFLFLYITRTLASCVLSGDTALFLDILKKPMTWIAIPSLLINFLICWIAFFGEEYGWRYYLQPLLQKKFGVKTGVILLGIVWGLWHLPVDFFYYSPGQGLAAAAAQQITCISLGIFFAWAYEKTNNIWVPTLLHFFNNNLVAVLAGNFSSDVLQNQQISWSMLPMAFIVNAVFFGLFLINIKKLPNPEGRTESAARK